MQIVTDRGMDLSPEQLAGIEIHQAPLLINLDGRTYRSGVDIEPGEFYHLLADSHSFPTTTQPSPGDFAELYRRLAVDDPDILSIHISSGLSGTLNAARIGAEMTPEAHVTLVDTKTLSGGEGWQVEAAARAVKAGWPLDAIVALLGRIRDAADTMFTLDELRYLVHGGRISHIKGLLAQVLRIRPVIGVEKVLGKYEQLGQARTFSRATQLLADLVAARHRPGSRLRVQVMHAYNPEGAADLRARLDALFDCEWRPVSHIAPVLGAHTGPSMIGAVFAPQAVFNGLPW
ncbi:MAG: DegV family protein [Anaerolineae bacterium]|jgi:DegV family protein with EDD domain